MENVTKPVMLLFGGNPVFLYGLRALFQPGFDVRESTGFFPAADWAVAALSVHICFPLKRFTLEKLLAIRRGAPRVPFLVIAEGTDQVFLSRLRQAGIPDVLDAASHPTEILTIAKRLALVDHPIMASSMDGPLTARQQEVLRRSRKEWRTKKLQQCSKSQ